MPNFSREKLDVTNLLYNVGVSDKELNLRSRLMDLTKSLRDCEVEQSRIADRILALQESVKIFQHYHLAESANSDSFSSESGSWETLQRLEVQIQARRFLSAVSSKPLELSDSLQALDVAGGPGTQPATNPQRFCANYCVDAYRLHIASGLLTKSSANFWRSARSSTSSCCSRG